MRNRDRNLDVFSNYFGNARSLCHVSGVVPRQYCKSTKPSSDKPGDPREAFIHLGNFEMLLWCSSAGKVFQQEPWWSTSESSEKTWSLQNDETNSWFGITYSEITAFEDLLACADDQTLGQENGEHVEKPKRENHFDIYWKNNIMQNPTIGHYYFH